MADTRLPRLILYSGLGADGRLFAPQRALPVRLETPGWPEPASEDETLQAYAARLAAGIRDAEADPPYLGGVSNGGCVALEIARHVPARGVFLLGSCRSGEQVGSVFRRTALLASTVPPSILHPLLAFAPLPLKFFEDLDDAQTQLYVHMLHDISPRQMKWSAGAMMRWESKGDPPGVPVYAIHGNYDAIIPLRNVKADAVIPYGRHLVSLTRARETNELMMGQIDRTERARRSVRAVAPLVMRGAV